MPARVKNFFCIFCSLFSFFRHTTPFTPKSGLICSVKSLLRRPRLVRDLSVVFSPTQTSLRSVLRPGLLIKGKPEYVLLDEQLVVYDKVVEAATEGVKGKKKVAIIVRGGPGQS